MDTPKINYIFRGDLIRVVDGDTIEVSVDRGFHDHTRMMVRLYGVDTPEPRGPERAAGRWVTDQVVEWIGDRTECILHSVVYRRDMYGRALFRVWFGDEELNQWLIDSGYGWLTDDAGKIVGVRDVCSLRLPDGIKQQVREAFA